MLIGSPQLGDLRFAKLATGWYWLVEPGGDYAAAPLVSSSVGASSLPVVSKSEVVLDTKGRSARFRVTGNAAVVEDDVRAFTLKLYLSLIGFGLSGLLLHALARQNGRNRTFRRFAPSGT